MEASWIGPVKSNGCHAAVHALNAFWWKPWSVLLHVSRDRRLEITCHCLTMEENHHSFKWSRYWLQRGDPGGGGWRGEFTCYLVFKSKATERVWQCHVWLRAPPPPTPSVICSAKTTFTSKPFCFITGGPGILILLQQVGNVKGSTIGSVIYSETVSLRWSAALSTHVYLYVSLVLILEVNGPNICRINEKLFQLHHLVSILVEIKHVNQINHLQVSRKKKCRSDKKCEKYKCSQHRWLYSTA